MVLQIQVRNNSNLQSDFVLVECGLTLTHVLPRADYEFSCRYDIPVLHINDIYWTKHRLAIEDAIAGIAEARTGSFSVRLEEPDASRLEHK